MYGCVTSPKVNEKLHYRGKHSASDFDPNRKLIMRLPISD